MRSACFTGHRKLTGDIDGLKDRLYSRLEDMAKNEKYTDFYAGGALGWDTLAAETVIKLKELCPEIKLHLILPCPPGEQTLKWKKNQREKYMRILSEADSVEIVSEKYSDNCMKERNFRLAELAECCLCFWNEDNKHSGTAQTVRMALKKGIDVYNFYGEQQYRKL